MGNYNCTEIEIDQKNEIENLPNNGLENDDNRMSLLSNVRYESHIQKI